MIQIPSIDRSSFHRSGRAGLQGSHAPGSHAPASHAPASHAPASHAPGSHAPASHAPASHAPASHAPAGGVPNTRFAGHALLFTRKLVTALATLFLLAIGGSPAVALAQGSSPPPAGIRLRPHAAEPDSVSSRGTPAGDARTAPGTGSLLGTVEDSLHGGALPHAAVAVAQLPERHAVTNESGAFRIDSLPPGKYTLEVTHPVLDSLGIRLVSDTLALAAGQLRVISMAIPSAPTLTSLVCSAARLRFGPGVIVGRVVEADTEQPAAGAEVSVAWTETEVGTDIGVRSAPRLRKATVAANGTYRICGLPASFSGSLQAERNGARTAEVPIQVKEQAISVRLLYLPAVVATSTVAAGSRTDTTSNGTATPQQPVRPAGHSVIRGKVTNAGGVPVADARISIQGGSATTASNADGSFTLTGVPAGTQAVLVRRVGYTPVELPIDVKSRTPNQLTVRLGTYTPQLATVEIKKKQGEELGGNGFASRRRSGLGKYVDEQQISDIHPTFTTDVLRRIIGLQVSGSGYSASVSTTRGNGCVNYLIDRSPVRGAGQTIDELVNSQDLSQIEFYEPAEVPLELSGGSNGGCALLVIWTKRGGPGPRPH